MKSIENIAALYEARRTDTGQTWRRDAMLTQQLMNDDIWKPMTERFGENEYSNVANLALTHMEGMAKRVVSTQPAIRYVSTQPGKANADARARKRQLANYAFWDKNNMKLIDRKRVRWLLGYGTGPIQIGPHDKLPIPKWNLRDPLTCFPAPMEFQDNFTPDNCIYAFKKTYAWVKATYPERAFDVHSEWTHRSNKDHCDDDQMFEVIEYIDAEERVTLLMGRIDAPATEFTPLAHCVVELSRVDNRLGVCPVVNPHLINIDRLKTPYVGNYGMYIMRNKLAALEYHFAENSVFPERWFIEPAGSPNGDIVREANAAQGLIGHARGGQMQDMNMAPNFAGKQMMDRLEREERIQNATPAEWGGESASNIRTGERGRQIVQAATDYTIQELQEILVMAKEQENRIAVKVDRVYFNKPKAFYVGWDGFRNQQVDYTPSEIWENDENHVFYAASGSDMNSLVVSGGQRIAQQTMSRESFMNLDPLIEDSEIERDRIKAEALDQAGFMSLMQPGALDPPGMAFVSRFIKENKGDWDVAIEELQKSRQEAQATSGEPGTPTGPVDPMSPEAQPGIAPDAAAGTIQGPNPDQQSLSAILGALRQPQAGV